MIDSRTQDTMISEAMREFPATFSLRGMTDKRFRISRIASYVNDLKQVMLYTEIETKAGLWVSYCKGTPLELRNAIVRIK
jgi:hypothetical protein